MSLVSQRIFYGPTSTKGIAQRVIVTSNFASQEPKSLPKRKKSLSDDIFAIKNCAVHRLMTSSHYKRVEGPKQVSNN